MVSKRFPLYNDVIQVILPYLKTNDLICALSLSKQWYQSMVSSASLKLTSYAKPEKLAHIPVNSAIARHVARAAYMENINPRNVTQLFPNLNTLLPSLTTLYVVPFLGFDAITLPTRLRSISIDVNEHCTQKLLNNISQLKKLRDMYLRILPSQGYCSVDYSTMLLLPNLESLQVTYHDPTFVADNLAPLASMVKFVRQTHLRSLTFFTTTSRQQPVFDSGPFYIHVLEPQPQESAFPLLTSGNLTSIDLEQSTLDGELLRVLSKYSVLTSFTPRVIELSDHEVHLFKRFTNPIELKIRTKNSVCRTLSDTIVSACQYLPTLRILHIDGWKFTTQQLDECLSRLPHLTEFGLCGPGKDELSLTPLVKYLLPERLTKLELRRFSIPVSELQECILPLQLQHLDLFDLCSEEVPRIVEDQLRAMPKLVTCYLQLKK